MKEERERELQRDAIAEKRRAWLEKAQVKWRIDLAVLAGGLRGELERPRKRKRLRKASISVPGKRKGGDKEINETESLSIQSPLLLLIFFFFFQSNYRRGPVCQ